MSRPATLQERIDERREHMSPAERQVARVFVENREEVLVASAAVLAKMAGTSDATVIRAARTLGFAGMDDLRRTLLDELRDGLSPATRIAETLKSVGDDPAAAFAATLDIHRQALERLGRDITPGMVRSAVDRIADARRAIVFGIGPSSAMAEYFATQLGRFGFDATSLTRTGLLLADGLLRLKSGDLLMIFAYGRVYRELTAMIGQARRSGATCMLFTDSLGPRLGRDVDMVLPVERGRTDMFSMHTATLALIEALLVGVAAKRPAQTMASLEMLNMLRAEVTGAAMDLPASDRPRR